MDHIATARQAILDLGSEDYYHIADAAAYLPAVQPEERRDVARQALLELLEEGLIQVFFGRFATNEMSAVPTDQVPAILNNPAAWDPAADVDDQCYCFANTDRGDTAYHSGHAGRP